MSDYPMLISNKLHSFRNFENAKLQNSADSYSFNAPQCGQMPFDLIFAPQEPQAYG